MSTQEVYMTLNLTALKEAANSASRDNSNLLVPSKVIQLRELALRAEHVGLDVAQLRQQVARILKVNESAAIEESCLQIYAHIADVIVQEANADPAAAACGRRLEPLAKSLNYFMKHWRSERTTDKSELASELLPAAH
jgi:hypothetical protein